MIPMRNDSGDPRRIGRGAKLYEADPGEVIDVYPMDVSPMQHRGFVRVDREADVEETTEDPGPLEDTPLEDRNLDELQELARERDLPGRSTLNKGELVAALRDSEE